MNNEQVLLVWINTILIDTQVTDITQFYDGVQLFQIMSQLNPDNFSMQDIEINPESWIHRFQNLQLFNNQLQAFYQNVLFLKYDKQRIELMKIAKNKDRKNIIILLENILGACLSGADRESYIDKIINLDKDIQTTLMPLIQQILDQQIQTKPDIDLNSYSSNKDSEINENQYFQQESLYKESQYNNQQVQSQIEKLEIQNDELNIQNNEMKYKEYAQRQQIDDFTKIIDNQKQLIFEKKEEKLALFKKLSVQNLHEIEKQFNQKDKIIKQLQEQGESQKKEFRFNYDEVQAELTEKKKNINLYTKKLKNLDVLEEKLKDYQNMLENHKNIKSQEIKYIQQINDLQQKLEKQNGTIQYYTKNMDEDKLKCIEKELDISKLYQENTCLKEQKESILSGISELEQKVNDQELQTFDIPEQRTSNIIQQDLEIALLNIQSQYEKDTNHEQQNEKIKNEILQKENEILRSNLNQLVKENDQIKDQLKKIQKIQIYKENDSVIHIKKKDEQIKIILSIIQQRLQTV